MLKKITLYGFLSVLLLTISASFAVAQEYRGTIAGKITDPNGSVVPDATVIVKNVGTNIETTLKTNDEGSFTAPLLLPGKYSVSVTANGFKTTIKDQITLNVDDRLAVDIQLEVGTAGEQVTVVADTELIERGSVTTGTVVTQRQIDELPQGEGAAYNLATQAPGVLYTGNPQFSGPTANGNLAAFRTNGASGNQITLDGAPNSAIDGGVAYTPPSDALSQFKIQTSSFDAQNGFTAGSTVNVAVKNGTNQFHGSGYYFDRSKVFTANNFFNNRLGAERPDRKYYRYGGQVNGPIVKDRTFFMVAYEKQYNKGSEPATYDVPTAKMRTGDFSELLPLGIIIYDPATAYRANTTNCATATTGTGVCRTPFAGNIIPTNRLNAAAVKYLNLYPLPNQPGLIDNYFSNTTSIRPYDSFITRIDHNISDSQRIFGKVFYSKSTEDRYNWIETDDAFTRGFEYRTNKGGNVNYTATLTSTLIMDLRGSYNSFLQERRPANPISGASLGFSGIQSYTTSTMAPQFTFTNYSQLGPLRSDYNEGLSRNFQQWSFQPTFTQIKGNHTLKYGYDLRRLYENRFTNGDNAGVFSTTGSFTTQANTGALINNASVTGAAAIGRDLASFLLGINTGGSIQQAVSYDVKSYYQGFFIQDDWRVTSNLTLNLGLRYELENGLRDKNGQLVTGFDQTAISPLRAGVLANYDASVPAGIPRTAFQNLAGGITFADSSKAPNQKADTNNIQPRVGASYALNEKTVIRGGFGIFTAPFQLAGINQTGFTASTAQTISNDNGLTFFSTLNNAFPAGLNPAVGSGLGLATSVGSSLGSVSAVSGPSASVLPNERKNSDFVRGVLGVQRELPYKFGFEATVVYSHGYNLPVFKQLNFIPSANLPSLVGINDYTTINNTIAANRAFLDATVPNPFRGLVPNNTTWNAANLARYRLLTANPSFQDLVTTEYNGTSDYASLQLQATKRFTKGLSLNASYTFAYDHEKVRKLNPQDENLRDMISTASRPHRVTFSGIYELPFGKKRQFGSNWNGWLEGFFGGWQFQGVYEWQSGTPLVFGNVYYNGDPTKLKNRMGERDEQGRRYGVDIPAFDTSGFYLTNPNATATLNNPDKLAVISLGGYATSGQNSLRYFPYTMNNLRDMPFQKFDAGLTKNFRITEKTKLQIRVEGINALNWVYFTGINLTPSLDTLSTVNGVSTVVKSTFGRYNSQRNLPRDIQLGARFTF